jgi:hypothetical protein
MVVVEDCCHRRRRRDCNIDAIDATKNKFFQEDTLVLMVL